jgi:hypothetical protein
MTTFCASQCHLIRFKNLCRPDSGHSDQLKGDDRQHWVA